MGLLVSLAALLCWRGAPVLTLVWRALAARRPRLGAPGGELADYERSFGSGPVGIRAVGPHLVAVVAVDGPPHSPSVLDYPRVESLAKLPLEAVAAGLRQFDVSLGRHRRPQCRGAPRPQNASPVCAGVFGPGGRSSRGRSAPDLAGGAAGCARECPRDCVAGVGGGHDERRRRMAGRELTSLRIPARVLTAAQIRAADEAVLAGIDPAGLAARVGPVAPRGRLCADLLDVAAATFPATTIDRLWAPDTDATVVSVQLRCSATGATRWG